MFNDPGQKKKIVLIAAALVILPTTIYVTRHSAFRGETPKQDATMSTTAPEAASEKGSKSAGARSSEKVAAEKVAKLDPTEVTGPPPRTETTPSDDQPLPTDENGQRAQASKTGDYLPEQSALSKVLSIFKFGGASKTAPVTQGTDSEGVKSLSSTVSSAKTSDAGAPAHVALAPATPELTDGCVTVSFQRKKNSGCASDEGCTQMRNLIKIKHQNPQSLCIRVNRTPVRFETVKGKTNEFIIGASAGLKAEITARYCFGKAKCEENCVVPKDDFMDAIGGTAESGDFQPSQVAHWEGHNKGDKDADVGAHLDAEMKTELDRLDAAEHTAQLFQDWIRGVEVPACGTKQAATSSYDKVN